jgi:hypothetical protein
LIFKSYRYELLQNITTQDKEVQYTFCYDVLSKPEDHRPFAANIISSDEAMYHISGSLDQHKTPLVAKT